MSVEGTPGPASPQDSPAALAAQPIDSNRSSDTSLSHSDTPSSHMVVLRPQHRPKSKVKVFQCTGYDDCNMTFSRSEHLARHIRKHTGERPFVCFCGRSFSRLDNLRQHVYTVHAKEGHIVQSNGTAIAIGSKTRRAAFDALQQQPQQQQLSQPQQQPQSTSVAATSGQPQPQPYYQPTPTQDAPMAGANGTPQKPLPPHPVMVMPMATPIPSDATSQYHPAQQTTAGGVPMMMMMGGTMSGQPMSQQPAPAPGYTYAHIPGQGLVQVPISAAVGGQPQVYFQGQHPATAPTAPAAPAAPAAPSHAPYPLWTAAAPSSTHPLPSRPHSTDESAALHFASNAPPASPTSTSSALDGASPLRAPSSFSNRQSRDRCSVSSVESSGHMSVASGSSSVRSSQTSLWLSSVLNDSNESPPTVSPQAFEPEGNCLPAVSQLGPLKSSPHRTDLLTKPLPKLPFEISNSSNS